MSADIINIPDNVLQRGCAAYADRDQEDIQWLFSYATQELGGSRQRLCEAVGYEWSALFRIATGGYGASIDKFMVAVRDLKRRYLQSSNSGFVETPVTRKVFEVLDYALAGDLAGGKIVLIVGTSRRGKTETIREWCRRNNHGRSVYVDTPESGGMRSLLYEIADACRINKARKTADLKDRVIQSFGPRRILILDEIARLMPRGRELKFTELEFIRRLHDKTHCAIALCATPVWENMVDAPRFQAYLEQLIGRVADPLRIPDAVSTGECRAILTAYHAEIDSRLLSLSAAIANDRGRLGVLFELLEQSAALARSRNSRISYEHLHAAAMRRKDRFSVVKETE
jgi:DNA transposition AAA+ family ATPase